MSRIIRRTTQNPMSGKLMLFVPLKNVVKKHRFSVGITTRNGKIRSGVILAPRIRLATHEKLLRFIPLTSKVFLKDSSRKPCHFRHHPIP